MFKNPKEFALPLFFLAKSGDGVDVRTNIRAIAHVEDAKLFKEKFLVDPSKFDPSLLAEHLSSLDELKETIGLESAAYSADFLCDDPMVGGEITKKLEEPLAQALKERGLQFVKVERFGTRRVEPKVPVDKTPPAKGMRETHGFSWWKEMVMWRKLAIGLGAALLIFMIVFCTVPLQTVSYAVTEKYQTTETYYVTESYIEQESYTEMVPYTEIETYYETEPFVTYETYTEREPYNKNVPIDYIVTSKGSYSYFWSVGFDAYVYIKNTDLKSGTFSVVFNLTLQGGAETTKSASKYIAIGDTEKVQVSYSGAHLDSFTYSVTPPTKTVTDYRDVEKTREVIEYRQVEKTREVTVLQEEIRYKDVTKYREVPKQRTVWKERPATHFKKVPLLEYLLHY